MSVCSSVSTHTHAPAFRLKYHVSAKNWSTVKKTAEGGWLNRSLDLFSFAVVTVFFFFFFVLFSL